jgi:hypothetical protein
MPHCRTTTKEVFSELMHVHVGQNVRWIACMGRAMGSAISRRGFRAGEPGVKTRRLSWNERRGSHT